jgi:hypothetical protein
MSVVSDIKSSGKLNMESTEHIINDTKGHGRLGEVGRCYGRAMNVQKIKLMTTSQQLSPVQTMIVKKRLENVEYFNYLGSLITNDARQTHEIKSRIAITKAVFNKEEEEEEKKEEETPAN